MTPHPLRVTHFTLQFPLTVLQFDEVKSEHLSLTHVLDVERTDWCPNNLFGIRTRSRNFVFLYRESFVLIHGFCLFLYR